MNKNLKIKLQKMKKELQAGTADKQRTAADNSTSASVEANPMLPATLSVKDGNFLIADFMQVDEIVKFGFDSKGNSFLNYEKSWNAQIPAFGKIALAVKTLIPKLPNPEKNGKWYFRNLDKYEKSVFNNEPFEGQKIITELLKWYNDNAVSVGSR